MPLAEMTDYRKRLEKLSEGLKEPVLHIYVGRKGQVRYFKKLQIKSNR